MTKPSEVTNSRNGILNLPKIHGLLNGLQECDTDQTLSRLKAVMNLLRKHPEMCKHFCKLGVQTIINYLSSEDKAISAIAFFILANCADSDEGTRIELAKEKVFTIISKSLEDMEHYSYELAPCIMFLLMSIIQGSGIGQRLVRESMCQHHLVVAFHRLLQLMTLDYLEEEKALLLQTWSSLCLAMKSCIANPQNIENQHQLGLVLPKALAFINNCFHLANCDNFPGSVECLITLLTQMISNNATNQLNFSIYDGMSITIRAIDILENSEDSSPAHGNVLEKLIHLLDASISDNASNCTLAIEMGAMPILIKVLHKVNNKHKIAAMVTLAHMVEMNAQSREEFATYNGIGAVALAMVHADEFPHVRKAANCLLQYCTQNISIDTIHNIVHSTAEQVNQSHLHYGSLHNLKRFDDVPMMPTQSKMKISNFNGHPLPLITISHQNNLPSTCNYSKMDQQVRYDKSSDAHHSHLPNIIGHRMYSRNSPGMPNDQFDRQHLDEREGNEETSHDEKRSQRSLGRINVCNEDVFVKLQPPTQYKCHKNKMHRNHSSIVSGTNHVERQYPTASIIQKSSRGKPQHRLRLGTNSVHNEQQSSYGTIQNSTHEGQKCLNNARYDVTATIGIPQLKQLTSERGYEHEPYSYHSCKANPQKVYSLMEGQSRSYLADYSPASSLRTRYNGIYRPSRKRRIEQWLTKQNIKLKKPRETEQNQVANSARMQSLYRRMHLQDSKDTLDEVSENHQVQDKICGGFVVSTPQNITTNLETPSRLVVENPPYSEEEINNLENGVFTYGMNFKAILAAYKFHPTRSSADLLLKWKTN